MTHDDDMTFRKALEEKRECCGVPFGFAHAEDCKRALRDSKEFCPKCKADLQGEPIELESQHLFGATHFSRKIGLYSMERDMTTHYRCPDCGHEWERS